MAVGIGDVLRNSVKEKLARDEVVASMTVRLVRQIEIAQIAATAGFDTLYIDVEHASVSLETTSQICIAALAAGIAPFVRVPANTPEYISRVLDGGALGIIAPHVGSAYEARAVVDAAKFPPLGSRSAAGAGPHLQYRAFPVAEANAALNAATTAFASAAEPMCGAITPIAPASSTREIQSGVFEGTRTKGAMPMAVAAMQICPHSAMEKLLCSMST